MMPTLDTYSLLMVCTLVVAMVFFTIRWTVQVLRGPSGRPYAEVTNDLYHETERRAALITEWAEKRERRLNRLDRRS